MQGRPIDEYIKNAKEGLSEADLNAQLTGDIFSQFISDTPEPDYSPQPPAATDKTAEQQVNIKALLAEATNHPEEPDHDHYSVDPSVKIASHAIKIIGPLLNAVSEIYDPVQDYEKTEQLVGALLDRLNRDTQKVIAAYGVDEHTQPSWLGPQISSQLMPLIVSAIKRNNGSLFDLEDGRYLLPLIKHAEKAAHISEPRYDYPEDTKTQITLAVAGATSEVMAEFQAFNYYHTDAAEIAQTISDFLQERVVEGTLATITEQFQLSPNEVAIYGNSLLKQAGSTLAKAWETSITQSIDMLKELQRDAGRKALLDGLPLDAIFERFESVYQGIEISTQSAFRASSPGREVSLKGGPRLG